MAKYRQECIFGIRAVIEAIQQEKEIDKVMLKKGVKGVLFQQLFAMIRERNIPFQYVPEEVFKPFADRNFSGALSGFDRGVGCCCGRRESALCADTG